MDFQIDLDPTHDVIRLTLTSGVVDLRCAEEVYTRLQRVAYVGGPYAGIYDLSAVTGTIISPIMVRGFAQRAPSIPMGRAHVVVGTEPHIYGFARIFQMCREFRVGENFDVVHSLEEAYNIVGCGPEDFTQRLFPQNYWSGHHG